MMKQEINKLADRFTGMGVHDNYDPMDTSNLADESVILEDEMVMNLLFMQLHQEIF